MIGKLVMAMTVEEADDLRPEDLPDIITPGREAQNRVGSLVLAMTTEEAAEMHARDQLPEKRLALAATGERLSVAEVGVRLKANPSVAREIFAAELDRPDRRRSVFRLLLQSELKQPTRDEGLIADLGVAIDELGAK